MVKENEYYNNDMSDIEKYEKRTTYDKNNKIISEDFDRERTREDLKFQYKYAMESYIKLGSERTISNYFFISINILILLTTVWIITTIFSTPNLVNFRFSLSLSCALIALIGTFISIYWYNEMRELKTLHEIRYRNLIDLDKRLFDSGFMRGDWNLLGNYTYRKTSVFYVKYIQLLPVMFCAANMANLIVIYIQIIYTIKLF